MSFWRQVLPGNQLHWYWQPHSRHQRENTHQQDCLSVKGRSPANRIHIHAFYSSPWYTNLT